MRSAPTEIDVEGTNTVSSIVTVERPGKLRWVLQPLVCIVIVAASLAYVQTANISVTEARSLDVATLLTLLRQHLTASLLATVIACVIAIPLGVLISRPFMRRYAKPVITVAGFGQAAPAIGLIAMGAVIFGIGVTGGVAALVIYGILPIVANTVTGLDGVDSRLVEAGRGMGMSARSTLLRVELPLALKVIVAGVRTALVLIVGTAALISFTGGGGLGTLITTGIKLQQNVTLVVGAILVAALALFIDWLARLVEIIAEPKGV